MNFRYRQARRPAPPLSARPWGALRCAGLLAALLLVISSAAAAVQAPPLPPGFGGEGSAFAAKPVVGSGPLWTDLGDAATAKNSMPSDSRVRPRSFRLLQVDLPALQYLLATAPLEKNGARSGLEIVLPLPDGSFQRFRVVESPMIGPEVQAMVPEFRTYLAQGIDDPSAVLRLDINRAGFHAYGRTADGALLIDPYADEETGHVTSAWQRDFEADQNPFECGVGEMPGLPELLVGKALPLTGDLLHTYRMILTLTGEYCMNFGGVTAATNQALTTLNRINTIFETDLSVRFNVVAVNAYADAATDPFTSGGSVTPSLAVANQTLTDQVYGSAAYDIGHILTGPNQGGYGYYNAVCTAIKAQGVTGFTVPYRPDFAVTYWAHELGHQFSARHSFNTSSGQCGSARVSTDAHEPGTGSTIMSYAGACAPENVQALPDAYFHVGSLERMIAQRVAATCAVSTATGNTPPVADAGPDQIIPRGTAFWVNGTAVDPDGDVLSYTWEQFDLGPASPPTSPYGPLFRSFSPAPNGARYFPDFDQIFAGSTDPYEVMPSVDRSLTLRLTVRDNAAGGGGVDDDELELTVQGAPFEVTSPNGGESYVAGQPVTVTWNVGGSVASEVVIWMISSSGFSLLLSPTPNDGSQSVTLPGGVTSTTCRIWIEEISGTSYGAHVFDVSNADFSLTDGLPDYAPYPQYGDHIVANSVNTPGLPTSLNGDTTSYLWWSMVNGGTAWACNSVVTKAYIDQTVVYTAGLNTQPGYWNGWGPLQPYVSGGRHTLAQVIDPDNTQPELNETNNSYARQWVWRPAELPLQTAVVRSQPPERLAGSAHIPAGVTFHHNTDAVRLNDYGVSLQAVAISSIAGHDYDLNLFAQSTGVENGFDLPLVSSTYGGAVTDLVVMNRNLAPVLAYDAGLLRYNGSGDYVVDRRYPQVALAPGGVATAVAVTQDQILHLTALQFNAGNLGRHVVEVDNVSTAQGVELLLFAADLPLGGRGNALAIVTVDGNGRAVLDFDFAVTGEYLLAVVRSAAAGLAPFTFDLGLRPTPPDIAAAVLPGSHGSVVPQVGSPIALGDPVPAPAVLWGDSLSTNLYFHVANNGPANADLWDIEVLFDGGSLGSIEWPFGLPGGTAAISSQALGTYVFPGGRHTAGMFFDSADEFDELFEDNNRFAEQWVWTPRQLPLGGVIGRGTPPDPVGGWDDIPVGLTREKNVDGLRTPAFAAVGNNGYLGGWAAAPNPGSDIDLRVHAAATGTQAGFDVLLESSSLAGNATEIVLFDLDGPLPGGVAYDIGAEHVSGTSGYQAHATESLFLNYDAEGPASQGFGPFTLGAGQLLGLFEFSTANDGGVDVPLAIRLDNLSGGVNLALAVFGRTDASGLITVPEALPGGFADDGDGGAGELVQLTLPGTGYWAVAVYKTTGSETGSTAEYALRLNGLAAVAVPDAAHLVAGITNYPNPFNPQTKLEFVLEKPGRAVVRIYDVQGRLVRTLVDRDLAAGRHTRDWRGVDDGGNSVASGVYLALFEHPGGVAQQRLVLLK